MNQQTLGTALEGLWTFTFNIKATVQIQQTGDTNNPTWVDRLADFPVMLEQAERYERQATAENYTHPLTHIAYCRDAEELAIGCRLVETDMLRENRTWEPVVGTPRKLLVMGIDRISGVPEPLDQVRLDLWEITPTRGHDYG